MHIKFHAFMQKLLLRIYDSTDEHKDVLDEVTVMKVL